MAESHFFLYSCYRGPLDPMGFGPLANFWGFGFGLPWTEKMGLYNTLNESPSIYKQIRYLLGMDTSIGQRIYHIPKIMSIHLNNTPSCTPSNRWGNCIQEGTPYYDVITHHDYTLTNLSSQNN